MAVVRAELHSFPAESLQAMPGARLAPLCIKQVVIPARDVYTQVRTLAHQGGEQLTQPDLRRLPAQDGERIDLQARDQDLVTGIEQCRMKGREIGFRVDQQCDASRPLDPPARAAREQELLTVAEHGQFTVRLNSDVMSQRAALFPRLSTINGLL